MFSVIKISIARTISNHTRCEYNQIASYARWAHRRPVRVLSQEQHENENAKNVVQKYKDDEEEIEFERIPPPKYNSKNEMQGLSLMPKKSKPTHKNRSNKPNNSRFDMLQTVVDAKGELIYTKMDNNDSRISQIMTAVKIKKERSRKNLILLEGKRLVKEALENKCKLKYLLFSRKDDLDSFKSILPKSGASLYKMPLREMQLWSDLTQCPGVMGIFEHPTVENFSTPKNSIPLTVICDNIREPGNLGSVLRVCAGVGCQNVILTKGCVNLWDTKVTRSACGAHFQLQIHTKLEWPEIKDKLYSQSKVFLADNNIAKTFSTNSTNLFNSIQQIPLLPYYSVPFTKDDYAVVVIGGETEGLSEEAYQLVKEFHGGRLNIPLGNGVESLNAGVAAGIILFEIRKQMVLSKNAQMVASNIG
nr:rRNA methyltransferase 3, mitochondrial [Onthophagus taurus]